MNEGKEEEEARTGLIEYKQSKRIGGGERNKTKNERIHQQKKETRRGTSDQNLRMTREWTVALYISALRLLFSSSR